jgi:hypothetical protein
MSDDRPLDETFATREGNSRVGIGGAARRNTIDERVNQAVTGKKKKSNNLPAPPTDAEGAKAAADDVGVVRKFIDRLMGN